MAFQEDFKDEDKKLGQPVSAPSYVGAGMPGAGAGVASPSSAASQRGGSGFVNLIDYVKANEGQGAKMAGDVVRPISQDMVTTNARQGQLQGQASGVQFNDDKDYSGLLDSVTKQQDAIKRVTGKVDALAQPYSLEEGLRSAYGQDRRYTRGQNTLDSFIAGSGDGKDVLGQAVAGFGKLNLAKRNEDLLNSLKSLGARPKPIAIEKKVVTSDGSKNSAGWNDWRTKGGQRIDDFINNNKGPLSVVTTQEPLNNLVDSTTVSGGTSGVIGSTNQINMVPGKYAIDTVQQLNEKGRVAEQTEKQKAAQRAKIMADSDYKRGY